MPDTRSRSRACLILTYAYKLLGGINILVNDHGSLVPTSIKDIWAQGGDNLMTRIYPEAVITPSTLSDRLINDYFRNYGYRESKKINEKRKLLLENKKHLLRKKK